MSSVVLDASAILCVIRREPGWETVSELLPTAIVSAVNLSEVFAKAKDMQMPLESLKWIVDSLSLTVLDFDEELAYYAGSLREPTRASGLSLGDRCCLALGLKKKLPVLTTDTKWNQLQLDIEVRQVRPA